MKKLFILALLVGSILAESGWNPGMTYIYSINSKSLSTLNEFGNDYRGVVIKGFLKLQAGSAPNVTLNGQLTELQYADIHIGSPNECILPPDKTSMNWKQINLSNTTFGVIVKDGMVKEILLTNSTTTNEANIIRTYLSPLQADLEGKNRITKILNKDYQVNNEATSFSKMEESITGQCETIYDISSMPENVIRGKPALAPILNSSQELLYVMDVVKISNFSNCKRHLLYNRGMTGKKNWDAGFSNVADVINRETKGRLIINGTLQNYTIHSTVVEEKIFVAPSLYKETKGMTLSCVNLTLVHMEQSEVPLLLNFEINTTLLFDYEYEPNGNIDIINGSFDNGKDGDSENKIRNVRHVSHILKNSYNQRNARDISSSSPDVYNTTDVPNSNATNTTNASILSEENITVSFLSNNTTDTPHLEKITIITPHTESINVETTTEIFQTSTTSGTADINAATSTMTYNSTLNEIVSTPAYDLPLNNGSASTMLPDTISNTSNNNFSNISIVLQFLNVSNNLQKLHLSSFTSIYPSNKNKSALPQRDIENAIKAVSETIASHILNFKSVIHENVLSSFCQLTFLISNVEYEVLHGISNTMYQSPHGSDEKQRLAWVVFRDAVAQSGTGPALILIKEWILYNKITINEAEDILGALPRTAELPNEDYIDGLFGIVQDSRIQKQESIHASAVLAFSNIIYQVHVNSYTQKALYPVHIFGPLIHNTHKLKDVYLKYLEEQLENAVKKEDSCKIHIFIRAICNVAHPDILNIFKQYLKSNSSITTFQKAFIIMSLDKITELYPEETRNFFYPIYINGKEHYEVRTAAVIQIMHSKPPANILSKIAELTQFDSHNQVIAAVKSSIQSATQLTSPEDEEFKENAKSVMHLLNSKNLGMQYSYHSFKSQMLAKLGNMEYRESFSYIGSDNSIVPKGLFINLERFLGGLTAGKEYYGILFSDTKKMSHILENIWNISKTNHGIHLNKSTSKQDTQSNGEYQNEKNSSSSFSYADNGNNSNKYDNEDQGQPESVLFLPLANGEKFITFGKNFSSSIKNWLQQKVKSLKTGYKFNYSKLFQRDIFAYAVPNVAGFLTQMFYRVPTIYHLTGKVKFNFQRSQQSSGAMEPEFQNMTLSGRLNLGYALNKQTDFGFVIPFNGNRYIVGYKEQLLINIPIIVNTTASSSEQRTKITTRFSPITNDTIGFYSQFNSQLYRQRDSLSDIVTKQSASPVQITDSLPQLKIVKRIAGLLLNASVGLPQTGNESYSKKGNMNTWFYFVLSHPEKLKSVHNINITFTADFPSNISSVTLKTLYENMININIEEADSKFDNLTSKKNSNRNSLKDTNNSTIIMELNILLNEDKKPKYTASFNYTWSEFSANTKCFFSIYEGSKEKSSHHPSMVTIKFDGDWAKAPLFNFSKAISNDPQSHFTAALFLGSLDKPKAITECNLQRSSQRKNYLLEEPETKNCQKEMQDGNYILPPCRLASQNANYLDQHNCSIKIEGLNEISKELMFALNSIHTTYSNFIYYPRKHSGLQNQFSLFTQFSPNFESAIVSFLFPNTEAKFYVNIHSLLRPIVKIHPTQTAIIQTAQSLLGNQYSPTCVLDKTKVNTFDNRTYSVKFGPCWFVLMALTYQSAADLKLSKNNILILIRDTNEGRVIRMMVGVDVVDITTQELNKQNSYKNIYVNNMQYRLLKNKVTKIVLSSENNTKTLLATVIDKIIKLQFTDISILFDGIRVQLMIGNKYRNQTLGLCGTFTGEESDDFAVPIDCNITDPKQFIASYAIVNNNSCIEQGLEWAKIAMNTSCSLTGDILIHSDFPKNASCHNVQNKMSDPRCMSRYNQVLQEDKFTCFSQRALTKCKPYCYPLKMVKKNVKFHCVETTILSKHFVEIIKSGKVHDFSKKPTTKNFTVDIPAGCYKC